MGRKHFLRGGDEEVSGCMRRRGLCVTRIVYNYIPAYIPTRSPTDPQTQTENSKVFFFFFWLVFDVYSVCAGVSVVSFYTAVGVLVPRFSFKYFLNRINHKVKAVAAPPLFIFSVSHPVQTQLKKYKYTNCPKCDSVPLD